MVRRAERGVGLAIRKGQAEGEVNGNGQHVFTRNQWGGSRGPVPEGNTSTHDIVPNANERVATYAVTDGVTDEHFDEVLTDAKDEGNLSRAQLGRGFQT